MNLGTLILRADASLDLGAGHLVRSLALAAIWSARGGKVVHVGRCMIPRLLSAMMGKNILCKNLDDSISSEDDFSSLAKTVETEKKDGTERIWVVIDGYQFDFAYQSKTKSLGVGTLVIDDNADHDRYVADIIVNQNVHAPKLKYSCSRKTLVLKGLDYVMLRPEFLKWSIWQRPFDRSLITLLITLGGGNTSSLSGQILKHLVSKFDKRMNFVVVAGRLDKGYDDLTETIYEINATGRHEAILMEDVQDMSNLMAEADIAITGGGSTSWELLFMGLPALQVTLVDNQRYIAPALADCGACIDLGWSEDLKQELLYDEVYKLALSKSIRRKMSEIGRGLVDGKGSARIVDAMTDYPQ